jgi:hypothetical protein
MVKTNIGFRRIGVGKKEAGSKILATYIAEIYFVEIRCRTIENQWISAKPPINPPKTTPKSTGAHAYS